MALVTVMNIISLVPAEVCELQWTSECPAQNPVRSNCTGIRLILNRRVDKHILFRVGTTQYFRSAQQSVAAMPEKAVQARPSQQHREPVPFWSEGERKGFLLVRYVSNGNHPVRFSELKQ